MRCPENVVAIRRMLDKAAVRLLFWMPHVRFMAEFTDCECRQLALTATSRSCKNSFGLLRTSRCRTLGGQGRTKAVNATFPPVRLLGAGAKPCHPRGGRRTALFRGGREVPRLAGALCSSRALGLRTSLRTKEGYPRFLHWFARVGGADHERGPAWQASLLLVAASTVFLFARKMRMCFYWKRPSAGNQIGNFAGNSP